MCLQTIYGLNSGVFLSTLLHLPYPDRGEFGALSRVCLRAFLPRLLLAFLFPRICAFVCYDCQPITDRWTVFSPPRGCESKYRGALSRRLHVLT